MLFHLHKWVTLRVEHEELYDDWLKNYYPTTCLYQRCKCGKLRVKRIDEYWTLEEVSGQND